MGGVRAATPRISKGGRSRYLQGSEPKPADGADADHVGQAARPGARRRRQIAALAELPEWQSGMGWQSGNGTGWRFGARSRSPSAPAGISVGPLITVDRGDTSEVSGGVSLRCQGRSFGLACIFFARAREGFPIAAPVPWPAIIAGIMACESAVPFRATLPLASGPRGALHCQP
jgi:hypothetical protein